MKIGTSVEQFIGNTPLVELGNIEKKLGLKAHILAKLEYFNPAGSVKDRVAKFLIDDAEKRGVLLPRLDGIASADEQLDVALKKGRFEKGENYSLFRFLSASHR